MTLVQARTHARTLARTHARTHTDMQQPTFSQFSHRRSCQQLAHPTFKLCTLKQATSKSVTVLHKKGVWGGGPGGGGGGGVDDSKPYTTETDTTLNDDNNN